MAIWVPRSVAPSPPRIDWKAERERIDLAAVMTNLLGPAPGRRGERGRRLWWRCPFHRDDNPSLGVEPGKPLWRCYGCDARGDAATLLMKLEGLSFPEAVARLTGGPGPKRGARGRPARKPPASPGVAPCHAPAAPPQPEGMTAEAAACLIRSAEAFLGTPMGAGTRDYLGRGRGLAPETIRSARLGFTYPLGGVPGNPAGIVIAWFRDGAPTLVKIRQPDGRKPKYREVFRDRARHSGVYPGLHSIRPGRPLIVTEGEFDCLLLAQELGDLAAVVTLGSASARLEPATLAALLPAAPWLIATDADDAGERAASGWPASARRVRPPGSFKDWTEAKRGGVDLRRWWGEVLAGVERPALFAWEELARMRWGSDADESVPGLVVDRPEVAGRAERFARIEAEAIADPDSEREREAIQAENGSSLLADAQINL